MNTLDLNGAHLLTFLIGFVCGALFHEFLYHNSHADQYLDRHPLDRPSSTDIYKGVIHRYPHHEVEVVEAIRQRNQAALDAENTGT